MSEYIALIHKDKNSAFGASFPDLPGCISAADNLEDLRPMITEALAFHLDGMRKDGDAIPAPSSFDEILKADGYEDAVAVMVVKAADGPETTVRVNITLPENTLAQIDRKAAKLGMSRSGFLAKAAERW